MVVSGICAAELEGEGIGTLMVEGRSIVFVQCDGMRVPWDCRSERDANETLWVFRLAAAQAVDLQ